MAVAEEELQIWVAAIDSVIYANEPQRHLDPVAVGSSAIHSLNNAVRGGHKVACCLLGMCHLKVQLAPHLGEFFEASTEKGFELLKQSADAEYVPAVYQLSECYRCVRCPMAPIDRVCVRRGGQGWGGAAGWGGGVTG